MNLLFLALEPPYPPNDGGRIRAYHLLRQAAQRHWVTCVLFADRVADAERLARLSELCAAVVPVPQPLPRRRALSDKLRDLPARYPVALGHYRSTEMGDVLRRLLESGNFDLAHVDYVYLAQYIPLFRRLPVVMNHNDVEWVKQKRAMRFRSDRYRPGWWLSWLEQFRWRRFELDAAGWCSTSIVVSQQDAAYFRKRVPGVPVFVVPNGVDVEFFRPGDGSPTPFTLLYTGKMSYPPNVDAVTWFCRAILPLVRQQRPEAHLLIVGRDPVSEVQDLARQPGVTVIGEVPDVRRYYAQASVYVVPLRTGGGTRLKIPEAMAMGLPVVSTSLGCEGLELRTDEEVLVADDPASFSRAILAVLADVDLCRRLGQVARRTAEVRFAWSIGAPVQDQAYHAAVARYAQAPAMKRQRA